MATGKHIGKVVLRVRPEEPAGAPPPAPRLLPAMPRTYMHPDKSYVLVGKNPALIETSRSYLTCKDFMYL